MVAATLLALTAAVLHAGWNLAVKQSGDRFVAIWGQFLMAGLIGATLVAILGRVTAVEWGRAGLSAAAHIPYTIGLVRAYDAGEFSHTYPVARGAGAVLAAVGGIAFLGDRYTPLGVGGLVLVGVGLLALGNPRAPGVGAALVVAGAIAVYSVNDATVMRSGATMMYPAAEYAVIAVALTATGAVSGRGRAMTAALTQHWPRFLLFGVLAGSTYALVQAAFRWAPVGYVTALRESSVVIAAVIGVHYLGETGGRRRFAAALAVVAGLVLLVVGR